MMTEHDFAMARYTMVEQHLKANGITDPLVIGAFADLPRHQFVPRQHRQVAYHAQDVPIGYLQTMLSPVLIAQALQALRLGKMDRILEVGTGSGYLTSILMMLGFYVYSLERIAPLAEMASQRWQQLGLENVDLHIGDGSQGLADMASFDAIIVTAYASKIPKPLALQLHPLRGRMIIPIGTAHQQKLKLIRREADRWHSRTLATIHIPAMIGRYGAIPSASV